MMAADTTSKFAEVLRESVHSSAENQNQFSFFYHAFSLPLKIVDALMITLNETFHKASNSNSYFVFFVTKIS